MIVKNNSGRQKGKFKFMSTHRRIGVTSSFTSFLLASPRRILSSACFEDEFGDKGGG